MLRTEEGSDVTGKLWTDVQALAPLAASLSPAATGQALTSWRVDSSPIPGGNDVTSL